MLNSVITIESQELIENSEDTLETRLYIEHCTNNDILNIKINNEINKLVVTLTEHATFTASKALSQSNIGEIFNFKIENIMTIMQLNIKHLYQIIF